MEITSVVVNEISVLNKQLSDTDEILEGLKNELLIRNEEIRLEKTQQEKRSRELDQAKQTLAHLNEQKTIKTRYIHNTLAPRRRELELREEEQLSKSSFRLKQFDEHDAKCKRQEMNVNIKQKEIEADLKKNLQYYRLSVPQRVTKAEEIRQGMNQRAERLEKRNRKEEAYLINDLKQKEIQISELLKKTHLLESRIEHEQNQNKRSRHVNQHHHKQHQQYPNIILESTTSSDKPELATFTTPQNSHHRTGSYTGTFSNVHMNVTGMGQRSDGNEYTYQRGNEAYRYAAEMISSTDASPPPSSQTSDTPVVPTNAKSHPITLDTADVISMDNDTTLNSMFYEENTMDTT